MLCLFFVQMCLKLQTEKTCQKVLDKLKRQCYNMQAVHEEFSTEAADDKNLKKVEKTFEKPLDKRKGVWYNVEALPHRGKSGEKTF